MLTPRNVEISYKRFFDELEKKSGSPRYENNHEIYPLLKQIPQNYNRYNFNKLREHHNSQFLSIGFMKSLSDIMIDCLNQLDTYKIIKIKNYFRLTKYTDVLMITDNIDKDPFVVIKNDKYTTIKNEYYVGKYCINQLREIIPTFAYTYGILSVTHPLYTNNSERIVNQSSIKRINKINRVETNQDRISLAIEYIKGDTVSDRIEDITLKDILTIILVLMFSLKEGYERFEFVHWDLHEDNVILRELDEDSSLFIPSIGKYIHIGNYLPTMIDFALSTYKKDDKYIYLHTLSDNGIEPRYGCPLTDIIKFCTAIYQNEDLDKEVKTEITSYFTHLLKDVMDIKSKKLMKVMEEYYYIYPNAKSLNISIDELINRTIEYCKSNGYEDIVVDNPIGKPIHSINDIVSNTIEQIQTELIDKSSDLEIFEQYISNVHPFEIREEASFTMNIINLCKERDVELNRLKEKLIPMIKPIEIPIECKDTTQPVSSQIQENNDEKINNMITKIDILITENKNNMNQHIDELNKIKDQKKLEISELIIQCSKQQSFYRCKEMYDQWKSKK